MNMKRIIKKGFSIFFTLLVKKQVRSYISPLKVNGFSIISKNTILGKNVNFNGMRISGCGLVTIGDNFHSGKDCLMISQNHNFNNGEKIPYDNTYICKDITIEDNVWFGDRVIVLGGVTIGEGAIIQAGSVVVNNIPKYAIVGGHPAKVFSQRDVKHYDSLKKQGKFH
jgi:acetyltransferase-like isoleucine patch superfamily enzyme